MTETKQPAWHPNRTYLPLSHGITLDSCFPGGNLGTATLTTHNPITIQLQGNTDVSLDTNAKYWLYFRIRGFRRDRPIKFVLKNANHLRKYLGNFKYRPYMVYREENEQWQACPLPLDITFTQNGSIMGSFLFSIQKPIKKEKNIRSTNDIYGSTNEDERITSSTKAEDNKKGCYYFSMYYPYSCEDLSNYLENISSKLIVNEQTHSQAYFNNETIVYSYERRKVQLITITSMKNIQSFTQRQPVINEDLFPHPKDRPYKLKNNPVIIFTARVHPSQTSSSFFVQGLIDFLLSNTKASLILRQLFIFQIIPMLNPDGVEHGNFRFDHQMRNLNRFYGRSSIQHTPSIRAAQLLIQYYKNQEHEQAQFTQFYEETYCRLFMYVDVHGHSSAIPSFIFGNHTQKLQHSIENKLFCKIMQLNSLANGFSKLQSDFSKKNMNLQQKYDDFSKQCSGRVFAGRSDQPQHSIFHSYTLQILPYWDELPRRKNQMKQKVTATEYYRSLGKSLLVSLLDIIQLNPQSKFNESELQKMRKTISRQCLNQQTRRLLSIRKTQTSGERSTHTQLVKSKSLQKDCNYIAEYISRWFNNQIFLKHFTNLVEKARDPKLNKFYHKICKIMQLSVNIQLFESQKKVQNIQICYTSQITQQSQATQQTPNQKESQSQIKKQTAGEHHVVYICRAAKVKQVKIGSKINKQTIQLRQDINEIKKRNKTGERQQTRQIKRQNIQKRDYAFSQAQFDDRYDQKIFDNTKSKQFSKNKIVPFQIKSKQIMYRQKDTPKRIQSICNELSKQNYLEQLPLNPFRKRQQQPQFHQKQQENINLRHHFDNNSIINIRETQITQIPRMKEQNDSLAIFSHKYINSRQEIKQKALKFRPSLKEQIEQQQKNLLPSLRKNRIFTIVGDHLNTDKAVRNYQSINQNKKRVFTQQGQDNLQDLIVKTKKILINYKKQQMIKDQINKRSSKKGQYHQ